MKFGSLFKIPKTFFNNGRKQLPTSKLWEGIKERNNLQDSSVLNDYTHSTYSGDKVNLFYHKKVGNTNTVYAAPSTDHLKNQIEVTINGFGKTLTEKLKIIKPYVANFPKCQVLIPIAQSQKYMFGLIKRGHFTTLKINFENGELKSATHVDSKWLQSAVYSLNNIEESVKAAFPESKIKLEKVYKGDQGMFDSVNCGRFTIKEITDSSLPKGELPIASIEQDFCLTDSIIENYEQRIKTQNNNELGTPINFKELDSEEFNFDITDYPDLAGDDFNCDYPDLAGPGLAGDGFDMIDSFCSVAA